MSGYISFSENVIWQGSSGLFRFTAEAIAQHLAETALATEIEEMIGFNLPYVLDLQTVSAADRSTVITFLRSEILPHARQNLTGPIDIKEQALERVSELAEMARSITDPDDPGR